MLWQRLKAAEHRANLIFAGAITVVILGVIVLSAFIGLTRPLGELLSFDLSVTDGCTIEWDFGARGTCVMTEEQISTLVDSMVVLPARYVGADCGMPRQETDGFDLILSSRDYGTVLLLFYENGTVKAGTEHYTCYAIDPAEYQSLRQLVQELSYH